MSGPLAVLAIVAVVLALVWFWWVLVGRPGRDNRRLNEIQRMVDEAGPNPTQADALVLAQAWRDYGDEDYARMMERIAEELPR